ncbi:MAG: hypothetical protein LBC86_04450 [Oscillospiraceae bacterium]|jgi:hypothetical protein|nr:hypothetical protein [Oscillospiraceae bacterium]
MIVTNDYFYESGFDDKGDSGGLEKALRRAERLIDLVSFGRVRGFENLHETAQERLKYAVCIQAEWFLTYGYENADDRIDHKIKIGDFSYESKNNGVQNNLAPEAQGVLKLAGLLYAGMGAQ